MKRHPRALGRAFAGGVIVAVLLVLTAAPASAHGVGGLEPTNYETTVDGLRPPDERLVHVHEVRVQARLDLGSACLTDVRAAERERYRTRAERNWLDRSADARALIGRPILPGLGGFVIERFSERPADHALRHALLHLAPGFVQCTAVLAEHLSGRSDAPRGAAIMPMGGYADSCYMWRSDGPLIQLRGILIGRAREQVRRMARADGGNYFTHWRSPTDHIL